MSGKKGKKPTKKNTSENLEREVREALRKQNRLDHERTSEDGFREYGTGDNDGGQK